MVAISYSVKLKELYEGTKTTTIRRVKPESDYYLKLGTKVPFIASAYYMMRTPSTTKPVHLLGEQCVYYVPLLNFGRLMEQKLDNYLLEIAHNDGFKTFGEMSKWFESHHGPFWQSNTYAHIHFREFTPSDGFIKYGEEQGWVREGE